MTATGLAVMAWLIQAVGIEERECRLENNDMDVVETVLDKDASAP